MKRSGIADTGKHRVVLPPGMVRQATDTGRAQATAMLWHRVHAGTRETLDVSLLYEPDSLGGGTALRSGKHLGCAHNRRDMP